MGKYDRLREFLSLHGEKELTLTLRQIEIIVGSKLPNSAYIYDAWWSHPPSHPQTRSWTDIGWQVSIHHKGTEVDRVVFRMKRKKD